MSSDCVTVRSFEDAAGGAAGKRRRLPANMVFKESDPVVLKSSWPDEFGVTVVDTFAAPRHSMLSCVRALPLLATIVVT